MDGIPQIQTGMLVPRHYIQTVNIAIGIYDKATGAEWVNLSYNTFFQSCHQDSCDNQNSGDVIVLYDPNGGPMDRD